MDGDRSRSTNWRRLKKKWKRAKTCNCGRHSQANASAENSQESRYEMSEDGACSAHTQDQVLDQDPLPNVCREGELKVTAGVSSSEKSSQEMNEGNSSTHHNQDQDLDQDMLSYINDGSDFDSDMCSGDFDAVFMEEEREHVEDDYHESDPDNPDDHDGDDGESNDEKEEGENNQLANFSFDSPSSNIICRTVQGTTAREAILLVLALSVRHNWSYESMVHTLIIFNTLLGKKYLPGNKKQLWRILGRSSVGIVKYAYCSRCRCGLGNIEDLPPNIVCACGFTSSKRKIKYFVSLSLKKQIQQLLSLTGIANSLRYPQVRRKESPFGIEDLIDGAAYKALQEPGRILSSEMNYSYTMNTDGFLLFNASKTSAWPILLRVNELPPNLRQSHILLGGLFIDSHEPNMNLFLRSFVDQANELSSRGVNWKSDQVNEVCSKFVPSCCCMDAKARCLLINMKEPTGYQSCNFCAHFGVHARGSTKFPVLPHPGIPEPVKRTHDAMVNDMVTAHQQQQPVNGMKGPSELVNMQYFDLGTGFSTDDLHPIHLGVTKFHTELLLKNFGKPFYIGAPQQVARISSRLLAVKTPTSISRKPRPLEVWAQWNGTEWRNWLLYYCVPCLQDILPPRYLRHLKLLANGVFLLSRKVVTVADCNEAQQCLHDYVLRFQEFFGIENMRFNVHMLTHVVDSVRTWGPLWAQSTFGFESWNHKLMKSVTSPKSAIDQIVTRLLINSVVSGALLDDRVSDSVKCKIETILKGVKFKNGLRVDNVILLGKGVPRRLNPEESRSLERYGYGSVLVTEFTRAFANGIEFRSIKYGTDSRSDNTLMYTKDDMFCRILSIILFENDGHQVCGMIVRVLDSEYPIAVASYIVKTNENNNVLDFLSFSSVQSLVIKISVADDQYVMPVTNHLEQD